jgi:thiol-disulfide isomerase/thioredoxin
MFRAVLTGIVFAVIVMISAGHASAAGSRCRNAPGSLGHFEAASSRNPAPTVSFLENGDTARTLADYRGKGVVVNFWATWCPPCVKEMPSLNRLRADLAGEGIVVLALSSDRGGAAVVGKFYAKKGITNLAVMIDEKSKVARAVGIPGLPTTVMYDAEGREIGRVLGAAEWDAPESIAFMRACLAPRSEQTADALRTRS